MIADFVKGRKGLNQYPEGIQRGILLHRAIDDFTDHHPLTRQIKSFFSPDYGLYAAAFVDVIYDHFLANDRHIFPGNSLRHFTLETYQMLHQYEKYLPVAFKQMFLYMESHNWLLSYRTQAGLFRTFDGLVRRCQLPQGAGPVMRDFRLHYAQLQAIYADFFPELMAFVGQQSHDGKQH